MELTKRYALSADMNIVNYNNKVECVWWFTYFNVDYLHLLFARILLEPLSKKECTSTTLPVFLIIARRGAEEFLT